ncbi:MAG: hypothetical protein RBG13Loki_2006 [Promethearchaeota archaeon CR_4]|nr:MAG: hypothetical protein RBG13Loki_2006 [Candidatus Lokiarchaeota archaeon CR_4]
MTAKPNPSELTARSDRIVTNLQAAKGKAMKDFPVPPFSRWLNGTLIDAKRGEIEIEYEVRPEMANPTGLLHGGMQCAMMDDCIGIMCATLGYEGFLLSISLHVDYLGKVKVGEKVRVRGFLVREGRNIVHSDAEIRDLSGNLIATANSNLLLTTFRPDFVKMSE